MKSEERRRYFRINQTVGIAYQAIDRSMSPSSIEHRIPNVLEQVSDLDNRMQSLIIEVKQSDPKIAELVSLFNQKLERVVNQLVVDSNLVSRIAEKVREVNISACGIAFLNDEALAENTPLQLELTLYPSHQKVLTEGRVISCDGAEDEEGFYVRIDFYGMSDTHQENLIQHIVKAQSQQIKDMRK